ncbi:MAG: hypothetical protein JWQ04_1385 [Pedosphaera sp.]|nr:hypothetical protein [Pedosphaera sp.]
MARRFCRPLRSHGYKSSHRRHGLRPKLRAKRSRRQREQGCCILYLHVSKYARSLKWVIVRWRSQIMAWIFSLSVECGTQKEAAEAVAQHFVGLTVTLARFAVSLRSEHILRRRRLVGLCLPRWRQPEWHPSPAGCAADDGNRLRALRAAAQCASIPIRFSWSGSRRF